MVVTGCLAERYREEIQKEIPEVDATVGIGCNGDIAGLVERVLQGESCEAYGPKAGLPLGASGSSPRRAITLIKNRRGLQQPLPYCAIPLIRGPLRSRIPDSVVEAAFWRAEGVKELIVVAQDITAFGADRAGWRSPRFWTR